VKARGRRAATRLGLLIALLAIGACASASAGSERTRTNSSVLTREEMIEASVSNVYDAVERLRPRWLQIRTQMSLTSPTEIVVFMDRNFLGGPEMLRQFAPTDVTRLRYMDGTTASATLPQMANRSIEAAIIIEVGSQN
jgi:hypothetical protein